MRKKTKTRCKTFTNLSETKDELRKVKEIPAVELNEYMRELLSLRSKAKTTKTRALR